MAKPISIGVASDTREFTTGVKKGVIEPLEDAVDSLDDVQRAGDDAGEELEGAFKKAQSEISDFKKEQAEAASALKRDFRDAGDSVGSSVKKGTDEASEGTETLKDNVGANAKEMAASFDGSVDGMIGGVQGLIAEMTEGFGPAGLAAGVIAAAGIGLVVSAIETGKVQSEEFKARVGELAQELVDAGEDGAPSLEFLVDKLKELAFETEDGADNLERFADVADKAGNGGFKDLANMYGMTEEKLRDLWRESEKRIEQINDERLEVLKLQGADSDAVKLLDEKLYAESEYQRQLGEGIGLKEAAAQAEYNYAQAGGPELEAKAALVSAVNDAYDEGAGDVETYLNAESGLFDTQAYIDSMNARSKALQDYQTDIVSSGLSPEAISFLNEQGVESASQMLAGYKSAAPDQQAELSRIWTEAGKENSGSYKTALEKDLPKTVTGPKITAQADTAAADKALRNFASTKLYKTIQVNLVDSKGKAVLQ